MKNYVINIKTIGYLHLSISTYFPIKTWSDEAYRILFHEPYGDNPCYHLVSGSEYPELKLDSSYEYVQSHLASAIQQMRHKREMDHQKKIEKFEKRIKRNRQLMKSNSLRIDRI